MAPKKHADIIDVANHAGVAPATVSRALNHPNLVKPDTRKRIQVAINETGYIRNRAAQAIHGKKSGTIGFIIPTLDNAIFANLIQAFSDALSEQGFSMLIAPHNYDLDKELEVLRTMLGHRVEGVALIGLDHRHETFELLKKREIPVVCLWNYDDRSTSHCVGADNYSAGQLVAQHLIDLGHREIATIFPETQDNERAGDRLKGVLDTIQKNGHEMAPDWELNSKYEVAQARNVAQSLLRAPHRPTAIIAGNDVIAQGAIYAAHSNGLRVPQDVSICGIGDFSGSADLFPRLTTVRLRPNKVGKDAAKMLVEEIHSPSAEPRRISIPIELKPRESTAYLNLTK